MYALLGETLSEDLGEHRQALKAFGNAINLEPARGDYYNGMGLEALGSLQEAITLDPRLQKNAQKDTDFAGLKKTSEFNRLMSAPAGAEEDSNQLGH